MAYGTLAVDTVQSSTAGTPPQFNDGNGTQIGTLCRAWVNFNGTTSAIRASFNVSSITKNGTGDYTLNFTNALSDANYSCVFTGSVSGARIVAINDSAAVPTASACRIAVCTTGGVATDTAYITVSIFR